MTDHNKVANGGTTSTLVPFQDFHEKYAMQIPYTPFPLWNGYNIMCKREVENVG